MQLRKQRSGARAGFTLIEVAIAVIILLVGLMALSASAVRVQGLARAARERMAAQNALRAKAEEVRSIARAGLSDPLGWGVHVTTALAALPTFTVEGLTSVGGAHSVGRVILVTDETSTDLALGTGFGLPRDFDGDGLATNPAVSGSARILPVVLEVRWTSANGEQRIVQGLWILGVLSMLVHTKQSGFTLVESLFAASLVGIVIMGSILLLSHDMEVSKGSISVQAAQNQAQTLIYALEKELSNARGERPVATLTLALGSGAGATVTLDSSHGFPPTGMLTIDRGTPQSEHIAYSTLASDSQTISGLVRGAQCSTGVGHAQNAEVLWSGMAELLALSGAPPTDLYDGQSLESSGPAFFRGDGTGLSYRMPCDPDGGNDFFNAGELQWGAQVNQEALLTGWCALYYRPVDSFDEATRGIDINHDGDTTDVFDIGQIQRSHWSTSNPATAPRDVAIGPCVVLQERCHYGSDLDGDGFADPIFLWDPISGRLHLRLFVMGRNRQGWPTVRRVESMVFLRNSEGG